MPRSRRRTARARRGLDGDPERDAPEAPATGVRALHAASLEPGLAVHRASRRLRSYAVLREPGSASSNSPVSAATGLVVAVALIGIGNARYYVLVTLATLVSLRNYLRRGVPATWEVAEGTR